MRNQQNYYNPYPLIIKSVIPMYDNSKPLEKSSLAKTPETGKAHSIETINCFLCIDHLFINTHRIVPFAIVSSLFNGNPSICLIKNLKQVIYKVAGTLPLKIKFTTSIDIEYGLEENKKIALLRIAREQMKNIIKHSYARNVRISLVANSLGIILYVYDDGTGFDKRMVCLGRGLAEIYKMAEVFNGTADINTSPGEGCSLTVLVPSIQCISSPALHRFILKNQ